MTESLLRKRMRSFSRGTAVLASLIGCLGALEWVFNISLLHPLVPEVGTVGGATPLGLFAAGASLYLLNAGRTTFESPLVGRTFGIVTALAGGWVLLEHAFPAPEGLLMGRDLPAYPGQLLMESSPATGICFLLVGISLMLSHSERPNLYTCQSLALVIIGSAFFALMGDVYNAREFYRTVPNAAMSLQTAVGFSLLGLGILHARPSDGFMNLISGESLGGVMLRGTLPMAVLIPCVSGWLLLRGIDGDVFNIYLGTALFALSTILIVALLLWRNAIVIERTEAERRSTEEHYRILFESNPLPMWVFDSETLRFLEVNTAATAHYGFTREEFFEMTVKDIRPDEEVVKLLDDIREGHQGLDRAGVWKHRTKDGTTIEVEITSHDLMFADRDAKLVLANDVTERKKGETRLREAEQRYRTTLDNMLEGCQIISHDWRYLYLNDMAALHGRRHKEELIGHTIMQAYPGIENTEMFTHLQMCMRERSARSFENMFRFPDGSVAWFNLSMQPVPEGVFILSNDITKEKEQAEELDKYHNQLEALVAQRTAQLEAANEELEAFSFSVSHDLRTPLRHINGFVGLLKKNLAHTLDTMNGEYLDVISGAASRMGTLIDDLLAFSRMSRYELVKSEVDVGHVVHQVIKELSEDLQGRRIEWTIQPLPIVDADPNLLKIVLTNLIANSIKYTSTCTTTSIEIGCTGDENGRIVFHVKDNGVGFDMQYAHKLFGVFQRLHRRDEFEGTGIGLASVRRIIQRHGGQTWAEGSVGQGATFYFSLPHKADN